MVPLQDLEDVRGTMAALDEVRAAEIEMDMELGPIEECYGFLQRCGVAVPREEMERVDSLRYTFKNLRAQAVSSPETVQFTQLQMYGYIDVLLYFSYICQCHLNVQCMKPHFPVHVTSTCLLLFRILGNFPRNEKFAFME